MPLLTTTLSLALFVVASVATGSRADDKFSGEDLNKLFERGGASQELKAEFDVKIAPLAPFTAKADSLSAPKKGWYIPPMAPLVQESQPYRDARALMIDPRFPNLSDAARQKFTAQWAVLTSERSKLLGRAYGLDDKDDDLKARADSLNDRAGRLNQEAAELQLEIERFNRDCAGWQPPDRAAACRAWRSRIESHRADLTARINSHNADVERWRGEVRSLEAAADALTFDVGTWNGTLTGFNSSLQAELDALERGRCEEDEYAGLDKAFRNACGKTIPACSGTTGCADLVTDWKGNGACVKAADSLNKTCFASKKPELTERASAAREAASACDSHRKAKCGNWHDNFGRCSESRHGELQKPIDDECGSPRSCNGSLREPEDCEGPDGHRARLRLFRFCIEARERIMEVCYEGGDRGHRQQVEELKVPERKCQTLIGEVCPRNPSVR